jgi:hypothetical protein
MQHGWRFWTEGKRLISWEPAARVAYLEDHDGLRLDWRFQPELEWQFRRQTDLEVGWTVGNDRLRRQDLAEIVEITDPSNPPVLPESMDFDVSRLTLDFSTRFIAAVNFSFRFSTGEGINFVPPVDTLPSAMDITNGRFEATLRPVMRSRFILTYLSTIQDDQASGRQVLSNHIGRLRFDWQFTQELSLRVIGQYETTDVDPTLTRVEQRRRLNGDLLVTWLLNPWTALYVGTNTNYSNQELRDLGMGDELINTGDQLNRDARQLFVKFSYLFRL